MASKKKDLKKKPRKKEKALAPEVVAQQDLISSHLVMDGTAATDFSIVDDENYSGEVIGKAESNYDIEKLEGLKEKGDKLELLVEGRRQIFELWRGIERLNTHTTLYVVKFLIYIGEILNLVKSAVSTRKFTTWRKTVFRHMHERYLQQAQQLAKMGEFAETYAAIGKKRLLALNHLAKELGSELKEIQTDHPFPDITEDMDGELLKEHSDALINLNRFKNAGLDFVSFDQAALIAAHEKDALEVKTVEKIKSWLNDDDRARNKEEWFRNLVMDKLQFPHDGREARTSDESLFKLLLDFTNYCRDHAEDLENQEWIESQKITLDQDTILQANKLIKKIARKFGFRLSDSRR